MEKRIKFSIFLLVIILLLTTSVSAEWTTQFIEDERKENGVWYAHSPDVKVDDNITAVVSIGTDGDTEWVILEFSTLPTIIKNGTNTINASVKWDDQESEKIVFNKYGDYNFIHFNKYGEAISKIKESNKMVLEFKKDGEDNIKITFPLKNAKAVINEIRGKF
jgi:hypothetical protein